MTTTSGLAWKIPGRVGDSPILGAGLYVDNEVGAAGSTGRGEANLYNLSSFLIVEEMRRGMSPKDAGHGSAEAHQGQHDREAPAERRGNPNFNISFFVLNKKGEYAGVSMYRAGETQYAVCTENGAQASGARAAAAWRSRRRSLKLPLRYGRSWLFPRRRAPLVAVPPTRCCSWR